MEKRRNDAIVDHAIRMATELMSGFGLERPNEEQMRTQ